MLADIIAGDRDEIIRRYRAKAAISSTGIPLGEAHEHTALAFLDELLRALRSGSRVENDDGRAVGHDNYVVEEPLSVPQIAQYRDICQSVTELAMEMNVPANLAECATLDRSVDEATARAVTDLVSDREQAAHPPIPGDGDRFRIFRDEVRTLVDTAILSFDALRTGSVGLEGSTGCLCNRSLSELRSLVDRADSDRD